MVTADGVEAGTAGRGWCRDRRRCRLRPVGYVHGRAGARARRAGGVLEKLPGLDCQNPMLAQCAVCGRSEAWNCNTAACRPCAARYRRRVGRVAESGCDRRGGHLYLLTLTAPGEQQHVNRTTGEVCRCTPAGGIELGEWNASHSRRWNHFRTRLRQDHPGAEFFRGIEVQKRGALHHHALVWSPKRLTLQWVRTLAVGVGYGHSVDLQPIDAASRSAAGYVTKCVAGYVTKARGERKTVPWLDVDHRTGVIRRGEGEARYRTWSKSRGWGLTMAAVRAISAEQVRARQERVCDERIAMLVSAFDAAAIDVDPPPI